MIGNGESPSGHNFVTSSSLSGDFVTVGVVQLNDGTLITSPSLICTAGNVPSLFNDINRKQLENMIETSISDIAESIDTSQDLKEILSSRYMLFDALLKCINPNIQLNIKVIFPTESEVRYIPVKISPRFTLNLSLIHIFYMRPQGTDTWQKQSQQ